MARSYVGGENGKGGRQPVRRTVTPALDATSVPCNNVRTMRIAIPTPRTLVLVS